MASSLSVKQDECMLISRFHNHEIIELKKLERQKRKGRNVQSMITIWSYGEITMHVSIFVRQLWKKWKLQLEALIFFINYISQRLSFHVAFWHPITLDRSDHVDNVRRLCSKSNKSLNNSGFNDNKAVCTLTRIK